MKIKKVTRFEFEGTDDIEFQASESVLGIYEVWINGVYIEDMERGARPTSLRALFYYETHCRELPALLGASSYEEEGLSAH